jgi:hypothetical protein
VASYEFCGPGTYIFPELAGPPGGGTLTAVPGKMYEFPDDPPGPQQWWVKADASSTPETVKAVPSYNPPADAAGTDAPVKEG